MLVLFIFLINVFGVDLRVLLREYCFCLFFLLIKIKEVLLFDVSIMLLSVIESLGVFWLIVMGFVFFILVWFLLCYKAVRLKLDWNVFVGWLMICLFLIIVVWK